MATVKLDPAKGIQIPNLTTTERNAISSPETGAIIWNTTTSEINQYNGSAWEITYTDTNTQIAGITSSADATAMTINATENVGVGVVPEAWNPVYDAIQVGNTTSIAGYSGGDIDRAWVTANGYVNTADGLWQYINTDTASQHEQRDGTHKFQVAPSGSADANITWTTGFEVLNDGKARAKNGLLFGTDTASSNTLDDYEEGTWTPNPDVEGSGTLTASGVSGNYTKIGRIVHYNFSFDVQAISGTASNAAIEIFGFPFTPSSAEPFPPITVRASGLGTVVEAVSGYYHKGANKVRIEEFSGVTTSNLSDHVVVGSSFKVSFTTEHT
jgi:hypothetical protein